MTYALGRRIEYFDQPAVRATVRRAATQNHRFSAYVLGIVESAAFQMSELGTARASEVAEIHTEQPHGAVGASQ
jgi:hypothetical protein